MKTLIVTLCAGLAGLGWFGTAETGPTARTQTAAEDCAPRLECAPSGDCVLVCEDASGETCRLPLPCEGAACEPSDCRKGGPECTTAPAGATNGACRVEVAPTGSDSCAVTCTAPDGGTKTVVVACPRS